MWTGSPALRPLSELLDIVAQLLIVGCSGIGQPSTTVAVGGPRTPRRKELPPVQGAHIFSARDTLASSSTPRAPL